MFGNPADAAVRSAAPIVKHWYFELGAGGVAERICRQLFCESSSVLRWLLLGGYILSWDWGILQFEWRSAFSKVKCESASPWICFKLMFSDFKAVIIAFFEPLSSPVLVGYMKIQVIVQCLIHNCWSYCTIDVFCTFYSAILCSAAFRTGLERLPNWIALLGGDEKWE